MPCLNEAPALPRVLAGLVGYDVVLCDNGSDDGGDEIAARWGARVTREPRRGYGGTLLAGIAALQHDPPEAVVIMDADGSHDPADLPALLEPIRADQADLVIGERLTRGATDGLTVPQRFGNRLATRLIAVNTGHRYSDMGPFRAIRWGALQRLDMRDQTWGWNVEMQQKAVLRGLRVLEVPVANRVRVGTSKISGTLRGVARAGVKIVWACWRYRE